MGFFLLTYQDETQREVQPLLYLTLAMSRNWLCPFLMRRTRVKVVSICVELFLKRRQMSISRLSTSVPLCNLNCPA